MTIQCPIQRILIPLDGSNHSKQSVRFAGCMGRFMGRHISRITLLHVMAGSYLSRHINYIDFRAEILKQSEQFKRLKDDHIERHIMPFLNEAEGILKELGVDAEVEKIAVDGDPAEEIIRTAQEGNFQAIMMARRGASEAKGMFVGSVTNKVLHRAGRHTVYVVGQRPPEERACPIPRILVLIDGSPYSQKGVEHAASLACILRDSLEGVTLLNVINIALYEKRLLKGQDPERDAEGFLEEARSHFLRAGVPEGLIATKIKMGMPVEEILKEIEEGHYTLVVIGRKGHSAKARMGKIESALTSITFAEEAEFETALDLLGGVSSTLIDRCQQPTIAIVSGR